MLARWAGKPRGGTISGPLGRAGRTTGPLGLAFGPTARCCEPVGISFVRLPKHGALVCQCGPLRVRPKGPAVRPARVAGPGEGVQSIGVAPEVNGRIRSRPSGRGETLERPACGARGLLEQQGQELPRGEPQQEQARESQQESGISCLSVPRHDGRPQGRWPTDGAVSRSRRSLTCGTKPGSAPGGRRNLSRRWPGNDREEVRRGTRSHLNLPLLSRLGGRLVVSEQEFTKKVAVTPQLLTESS